MVHTYSTPQKQDRRAKKGEKGKKKRGNEKGNKEEKKRTKINMRSGRRPGLEGTRSLFAGTISHVICPGDGPTEGCHDKTRRKTSQEK